MWSERAKKEAIKVFLETFKPEPQKKEQDLPVAEPSPPFTLQTANLCFAGPFSPETVVQRLSALIPTGTTVQITIDIRAGLKGETDQ